MKRAWLLLPGMTVASLGVVWAAATRWEIQVIRNPRPTFQEVAPYKLVKKKVLRETANSKYFLAKPQSLALDDDGSLFVYDHGQGMIARFDKELNFITAFGRRGQGPGEFGSLSIPVEINLGIGKDGLLYAGDRGNRVIHCFDRAGKLVRDYPLNIKYGGFIVSVFDQHGNFLVNSDTGIIDRFSRAGKLLGTLLSNRELAVCLFSPPPPSCSMYFAYAYPGSVSFLSTGDAVLLLYHLNGKYMLLRRDAVQKRMYLWSKESLAAHARNWRESTRVDGIGIYYTGFFLDQDDQQSFYAEQLREEQGMDRIFLYHFTFDGRLVEILVYEKKPGLGIIRITGKKHNQFYAMGYNHPEDENLLILQKEGQ